MIVAPCGEVQERALKHEFNAANSLWTTKEITISMGTRPFQEGTMRTVYAMKDFSLPPGHQDCVAKISKNPMEDRKTYFAEVEMQMQCKQLAMEFNKRCPPKKIDFIVPCVVEITRRRAPNGGPFILGVEPALRGRYQKHSNNYGFVSPDDRNTPAAFSHFTYCLSGGRLLVCDIQGVEDLYTDPQIHSNEGHGIFKYGKGDMGVEGIRQFFATHKCNPICEFLGLAPTGRRKATHFGDKVGTVHRPRVMSLDGGYCSDSPVSSVGSSVSSNSSGWIVGPDSLIPLAPFVWPMPQ